MAGGGACIEDYAELTGTDTRAQVVNEAHGDRGRRFLGPGGEQEQEAPLGGPVEEEQFFGPHVLVASRVVNGKTPIRIT